MLAVYAAYAGQHGGRTVARPAHEPEALIQFDELLLTVIATALCLAVGLSCAGTLLNAHAPRRRGARGGAAAAEAAHDGEASPPELTTILWCNVATVLAKTCVAPLELAKLLMQVQDAQRGAGAAPGRACATASAPRFAHAFECVHYIAATHGPRALWAGHGATLARYVPV